MAFFASRKSENITEAPPAPNGQVAPEPQPNGAGPPIPPLIGKLFAMMGISVADAMAAHQAFMAQLAEYTHRLDMIDVKLTALETHIRAQGDDATEMMALLIELKKHGR